MERGSEGSSGWGWCLGLISLLVIIVASCCVLDAWASQRIRAPEQQHSSARQSRQQQQISARKRSIREPAQESHLVGSFLASLRRGHSQLLPNTPHGQQKYADACTCSSDASMVYPCVM